MYLRVAASPYILCQCLQVRLDGHLCAVHAVTDKLRSVCLTYICLCYAGAAGGEQEDAAEACDGTELESRLPYRATASPRCLCRIFVTARSAPSA